MPPGSPLLRRRLLPRVILLALAAAALLVAVVSCGGGSEADGNTASSSTTTARKASTSQLENPKMPGKVVFVSNFEREGFPEWFMQALPHRARIVHGQPYEGDGNALFEVRPGDVEPQTGSQRAEGTGPTFEEGDDIYVRTAFRIPKDNSFRGPWQLIQQFHEAEGWGGSPGTAIFLTSDRRIRIGHGDATELDWQSKPLATDRWYDLTYRVKFSSDPKVGFMEVWFDGKKQRLRDGHFRQYGFTTQMKHTYLKTGIYRSRYSHGISRIEDDSLVITELPN